MNIKHIMRAGYNFAGLPKKQTAMIKNQTPYDLDIHIAEADEGSVYTIRSVNPKPEFLAKCQRYEKALREIVAGHYLEADYDSTDPVLGSSDMVRVVKQALSEENDEK